MSQHQKFVKAKKVVDKLPSLASEVGMKEFIERIDVLQCIHDIWAHGHDIWAHGGKVIVVEDDALGDNEGTTGLWRCLPAWEVVLGVLSLNAVCVDGVRNEEVKTEVDGVENDVEIGPGNEFEVGVGNEVEVRYCGTEYEVLDESLNEQSE